MNVHTPAAPYGAFTLQELAVMAAALDFMATESTLQDRQALPYADLSSAPLVRLADRVRAAA